MQPNEIYRERHQKAALNNSIHLLSKWRLERQMQPIETRKDAKKSCLEQIHASHLKAETRKTNMAHDLESAKVYYAYKHWKSFPKF